jgi:ATP-dependent exoDNAse (exonuclease V) alpha subunit
MGFGIRNDERWVKHTTELSRNFRSEPRNDDSKVSLDAVASVVRSTALPKTSGQTQAIQSQVIEELLQAIEISDETDRDEQAVKWRRIKTDADTAYSQAVDQAMKHYDALVRQCLSTLNSTATHAVLAEFRVLAARRDGAYGIERLNHDIEQRARRLSQREGRQANDALYPVTAREWFIGRVVMVRENSRSTGLANGDVGVYLADGYVHFEQYEVEDSTPEGTPRRAFLPSELPLYEVAYAITIHKAQGSEFQEVLVMCDGDTATRSGDSLSALNHALIYTAITRAKRGVALYASHQTLLNGLLNQKSLVSALPLLLQAQL